MFDWGTGSLLFHSFSGASCLVVGFCRGLIIVTLLCFVGIRVVVDVVYIVGLTTETIIQF